MSSIQEKIIVYKESIALRSGIKGEYQDILIGPDGEVVWERPWRHNLILNGMSLVLSALLKGDTSGKPVQYWAVGTEVGNLTLPPGHIVRPHIDNKRQRTHLNHEIYRKPIDFITFLDTDMVNTIDPTNHLEIKVYFTIDQISEVDESVKLREFGLFAGGNNNSNTGILINHRTHPTIELKKGFTLQRSLRLTF